MEHSSSIDQGLLNNESNINVAEMRSKIMWMYDYIMGEIQRSTNYVIENIYRNTGYISDAEARNRRKELTVLFYDGETGTQLVNPTHKEDEFIKFTGGYSDQYTIESGITFTSKKHDDKHILLSEPFPWVTCQIQSYNKVFNVELRYIPTGMNGVFRLSWGKNQYIDLIKIDSQKKGRDWVGTAVDIYEGNKISSLIKLGNFVNFCMDLAISNKIKGTDKKPFIYKKKNNAIKINNGYLYDTPVIDLDKHQWFKDDLGMTGEKIEALLNSMRSRPQQLYDKNPKQALEELRNTIQ